MDFSWCSKKHILCDTMYTPNNKLYQNLTAVWNGVQYANHIRVSEGFSLCQQSTDCLSHIQ